MAGRLPDARPGTGPLVLLILRVLRSGPLHGYAIAQRIHTLSSDAFRVEEGSPHRRRFDDELADEMAFHREMAGKSGGVPLGNVLQLREASREAWAAVLVLAIGIGAAGPRYQPFAARPAVAELSYDTWPLASGLWPLATDH